MGLVGSYFVPKVSSRPPLVADAVAAGSRTGERRPRAASCRRRARSCGRLWNLETALVSVGGSAGAPSAVSSLKGMSSASPLRAGRHHESTVRRRSNAKRNLSAALASSACRPA